MTTRLPASTTLGSVRLRVADLRRSLAFYQELIGFSISTHGDGTALLCAGEKPLIELVEHTGIVPRPRNAAGLFHVAVLMPDRPAFGAMLRRLAENAIRIGASDHIVSEALYLEDPDGNGIEIYCDRPIDTWRWIDGEIEMATASLDTEAVLGQAAPSAEPYLLPDGTRIGHIHLQVGDLAAARSFYVDRLGFDITTQSYPGALFVSAGGYHHHLGLNVWYSKGQEAVPSGAAGLDAVQLILPHNDDVMGLRQRLEEDGIGTSTSNHGFSVTDPWNNRIEIAASSS